MIDVEAHVFDYVYQAVSQVVPEGCFRSVFVPSPSRFPFATLMEMDNYTDARFQSTSVQENYAIVAYEANVYAMDKQECRDVMATLDGRMIELGFTRLSMQFVPNLADSSLFRLTARYRAEADPNKVIYRHG